MMIHTAGKTGELLVNSSTLGAQQRFFTVIELLYLLVTGTSVTPLLLLFLCMQYLPVVLSCLTEAVRNLYETMHAVISSFLLDQYGSKRIYLYIFISIQI